MQAEEAVYDVVVVGAGMMGSSAARHILNLNPQLKVGLIGPQVTEVRTILSLFNII